MGKFKEKSDLVSVRPPRKPRSAGEIALSKISEDDCYDEFLIRDADVTEQEALDVRFLNGTIEHSKFIQTILKQIKLADITLHRCDISNAKWEAALLSRVIVANSKLTGLQMQQGKLTDIQFRESKIDLAQFTLSKFTNVIFEDCVLTDVIFQECEMENVAFRKCDLTACDFSGARLKNVDLRESKIEKIALAPEQFKGLIIEPSQASYLIGLTGAKVKYPEED